MTVGWRPSMALDHVARQRSRRALRCLLGRSRTRHQAPQVSPPVQSLLDVDREYRQSSAAGRLPKIAPKRFNPEGLAWLPILHTDRGKWHFTALFSNTARAHELGRTDDWRGRVFLRR